ncbi:MAG: amino acid ABC transporter permease [Sporomusaceae bacterium]|nr:amino acid ABC transporter permease [Sporomusaceae bacterium]
MRPFEPLYILEVIPDILPYLWVTLTVVAASVAMGTLLGFALAAAKLSRRRLWRLLGNSYTYVIRCTPSIILLFIVFYGLPKFFLDIFGYDINEFHKMFFVVTTFALLFAASISEVMRSAYLSIDKGQYEAAVSVGLTPFQAFYRVLLPQGTVIALPNFGNAFITLLKEGALAYTIGLIDLLGAGNLIIARNYGSYALEIYLALSALYWGVAIAFEKLFEYWENRLSRYKRARAA